ncbi:MAG: hypothetical protein JKY56_02835 [Kofleriaceae bacterium]|nr:hypothetical protein [Kofleriaceae bacterium]
MADEQNDKDSVVEEESTQSPPSESGTKESDPSGSLAADSATLDSDSLDTDSLDSGAHGSDELDPELIKLPRPATRIRPIMALAIIAICAVLILRLWNDLSFSREGDIVVVDTIADLNDDLLERYVEIEVTPDRQQAIRLLPSRKTTGPVLMPALGHSKELWIFVHPTPWTEEIRTDERYRGRLSRLSDQSFYDEMRSYYRSGKSVPRPMATSEVRKTLKSGAKEIRDLSGESFALTDDTVVRVQETSISKVRIVCNAAAVYIDEPTWRIALQAAGFFEGANLLDQTAVSHTVDSWTFEVPLRSGLEEIERMLTDDKLFAAKAEEIVVARSGTWKQLSLDGEEILMGKSQTGYTLKSIELGLAIEIPADAYIINSTESPDTYWYMLALVLLLVGFAAIFIFGFVANLRR